MPDTGKLEANDDLVASTFGSDRVRHGSTEEGVWRPRTRERIV